MNDLNEQNGLKLASAKMALMFVIRIYAYVCISPGVVCA